MKTIKDMIISNTLELYFKDNEVEIVVKDVRVNKNPCFNLKRLKQGFLKV